MASVGGKGKSGDDKTRGIYKTSETRGCATEEKKEFSKKVTSIKMK